MPVSRLKCALTVSAAVVLVGTTGLGQSDVVDPEARRCPIRPVKVIKNLGCCRTADVGIDRRRRHRPGRSRLGVRPVWRQSRPCDTSTSTRSSSSIAHTGKMLASFGAGCSSSRTASTWIATATSGSPTARATRRAPKGHQVIKFSPEGKVLMRLGKRGRAGQRSRHASTSRAT